MTKKNGGKQIHHSSELPDKVGCVFITDVRSSWFQIIGRRHAGEHFVGCHVVTPQGEPRPAEMRPLGVEIPSGPKAEALIRLVGGSTRTRLSTSGVTS